jgi:hypothetical protein
MEELRRHLETLNEPEAKLLLELLDGVEALTDDVKMFISGLAERGQLDLLYRLFRPLVEERGGAMASAVSDLPLPLASLAVAEFLSRTVVVFGPSIAEMFTRALCIGLRAAAKSRGQQLSSFGQLGKLCIQLLLGK